MSKLQKVLGQGAGTVVLVATLAMPGALQALEGQIVPGASRTADVSANLRLHALPHQPGESPHTGIHGQILFGLNSLFMVYLPVFISLAENHSHNFQVIVEVLFANPAHLERYRANRMAHADEIYTAVHPFFDQTVLVLEHEGRESLRRLPRVKIVRGHLEQGGETIIKDATLDIVRLVEFRVLDRSAEQSTISMHRLYGRGEAVFLTHILSGLPDCNKEARVRLEVTSSVQAVLEDVVERDTEDAVPILGGADSEVTDQLDEGISLPCRLMPIQPTWALPVEAIIMTEWGLYSELGELSGAVDRKFNTPQQCG